MAQLSILVVDDEANIRKTLAMFLESRGHSVVTADDFRHALDETVRSKFDLAFVDLRLGTRSGLDLLQSFTSLAPSMKVVVMTAFASIETAVEAMKRGAADYIAKPFTPAQLELLTERLGSLCAMERKIASLQDTIDRLDPEVTFISHDPSMQQAIELARQVAPSEAAVLLRGPSGTGKSILARAIHMWSRRSQKPFGTISCPSLSTELLESELFGHVKGAFTGALRDNPGRIAAYDGGTLFLDEIGDLPISIQPKLLRFIQEREYERVGDHQTRHADVRIITATNIDLEQAVAQGRFREDLLYRLNVVQINLPSLGERKSDIGIIAESTLAFFNARYHKTIHGFDADVLRMFREYAWPGNIRELRNVIERAVILCDRDVVGQELLPESIRASKTSPDLGDPVPLEAIEELHIRKILEQTKSLQEAADILGIDQATLWRKRKHFGIQ
jgi:two-component system, NtrC family, response regulator AlgB